MPTTRCSRAAPRPAASRSAGSRRTRTHPLLAAHRRGGGATAGVRDGRLVLFHGGAEHDLGAIAAMPLAAGGHSHFNVANLATAALGAAGLGIAPATIAAVFARFGADPEDNAGRLMRYELGGLDLIVDFAHNPTALAGLVDFARHLRGNGRLALLLGQAGNREDADIDRLAAVAASARPDFVVVKELTSYLRGRDSGEVPALLKRALERAGVAVGRDRRCRRRGRRGAPRARLGAGGRRAGAAAAFARGPRPRARAASSACGATAGKPASPFRPRNLSPVGHAERGRDRLFAPDRRAGPASSG